MSNGLIEAIDAYLDFIASSDRLSEDGGEKSKGLLRHLDTLAAHTHAAKVFVEYTDNDADDSEAYRKLCQSLPMQFPDYAHYPVAYMPAQGSWNDAEIVAGDPYDDMADIARDLWKALNVAKHSGFKAAQYEFLELHDIHWGYHLRTLQFYLYHRIVDR